jgi:hypothetical protein
MKLLDRLVREPAKRYLLARERRRTHAPIALALGNCSLVAVLRQAQDP